MALALAFALTLLAASLVCKHERRTVGKYDFHVGWMSVPTYAFDRSA